MLGGRGQAKDRKRTCEGPRRQKVQLYRVIYNVYQYVIAFYQANEKLVKVALSEGYPFHISLLWPSYYHYCHRRNYYNVITLRQQNIF